MSEKKILVFSNRFPEIGAAFSTSFLKEFVVLTTSDMLDAIRLLKREEIGMVLAVGDFNKDEKETFKSTVEMLKPGVNVIFFKPGAESQKDVTLSGEDFSHFLNVSLETETSLSTRLTDFKDFFMSFADRMLQIFGATNLYFFNKDHLVARLSQETAIKLKLGTETAENIKIAALLRDIGMLSIQQQLLQEKRQFSSNELTSLKKHPQNTVQILKQVKFPWNVDSIILQHHENYDGSGYPTGLKGRNISVGARIVHLADSYVAMTTERPHRPALSHEQARLEIVKHMGTQFDPEITEQFLAVLDEEMAGDQGHHTLLIFEAEPNISRIIKLGADMERFKVVHATTTTELLENVNREVPNLTLIDVSMLNNETLINFFNTMYEIPLFENCPFIFVMTNPDFDKHFSGKNVRYIDMPICMDDLMHQINELLGVTPLKHTEKEAKTAEGGEEEGGLSGSLEDFNLTEIVQILQMGVKTAKVDIKCNGYLGLMHMHNGNIVHASTNGNNGEDAFFEMMRWPKGRFRIQHGIHSEKTNIKSETNYLLLESARILDERSRALN